MKGYGRFFRRETPLASYGLSPTFLSSPGQTFLVSLSVLHVLGAFPPSAAGSGILYSGATLTSALLLPGVAGCRKMAEFWFPDARGRAEPRAPLDDDVP